MSARLSGDPIAPRTHNPEISLEIEEIILHGLARDPSDRYSSAAAMNVELDAPERVEVTGRANRLKAPVPFDSRWRLAGIMAVALVVPVLLFFLFLLILRR
jgi:serine/threonine protein kinase